MISFVVLWANGQVMVHDLLGNQLGEYQGSYDDVKDQIRAVYTGPWSFGVFESWKVVGLSFAQIEQTVVQLKACWHDELVKERRV